MELHHTAVEEEKGYSAVETLLCLIIVLLVSFIGYYVYTTKHNADSTLTAASKTVVATVPKTTKKTEVASTSTNTTKYLDIKEWGVKAPYTGDDTYTYHFVASNNKVIDIVSAQLATKYTCTDFGAGAIGRNLGSDIDNDDPDGRTFAQEAAQSPNTIKQIGNYYYSFGHDQAACPTDSNKISAQLAQDENAANTAVSKLIPLLQAD